MDIEFILYFKIGTINKTDIIQLYRDGIHFVSRGMYVEDAMKSECRFNEDKFINSIHKVDILGDISLFDKNGFDYSESFSYYPVGNTIEYISLNYKDKLPDINKFTNLLQKEGFIHAAIFDSNFNYWQNVEDIDIYKSHKKDIDSLYFTKNKITGKKIIDVSRNPGSNITFEGEEVIFKPSWTMYFGKASFRLCSKDKFKQIICMKNVEVYPDVIEIKLFENISESSEHLKEFHRFRKDLIPNTPDEYAPKQVIKKRFWELW